MKFLEGGEAREKLRLRDVMTSENLVVGPPDTSLREAAEILKQAKVEKLLLVDKDHHLAGLITMRDIERSQHYPGSCKDVRGRLRVGAAVGVHDYERVAALIQHDVDVVVVDTAHGHTDNVINTIKAIRKKHDISIIAGNIATQEAARDLIAAGVDALKVGIGPGSICTTRVVSGVGVPAAGAHTVMMGGLFAGLEESPGESVTWKGRRFKEYRGMGSLGAMMEGSADRYGQQSSAPSGKLVPEGVEGRVPYRGPLADFVHQLIGGVRSGMGYCGAANIDDLRTKTTFYRVTAAGVVESHPHDVAITKESPNYAIEYPTG
jgi:IMP dehydrogenase